MRIGGAEAAGAQEVPEEEEGVEAVLLERLALLAPEQERRLDEGDLQQLRLWWPDVAARVFARRQTETPADPPSMFTAQGQWRWGAELCNGELRWLDPWQPAPVESTAAQPRSWNRSCHTIAWFWVKEPPREVEEAVPEEHGAGGAEGDAEACPPCYDEGCAGFELPEEAAEELGRKRTRVNSEVRTYPPKVFTRQN